MKIDRSELWMLCVLGLLVFGFVAGAWWPHRATLQSLEDRILAAEVAMGYDRNHQRGQLTALAQEVGRLRKQVSDADKYVPEHDDWAVLHRELTRELARQNAVEAEINTRPIDRGVNFNVVPVSLRFRGTFPAVAELLQGIESNERLIRVTKVELNGRRGEDKTGVDARIELATFYAGTEGER